MELYEQCGILTACLVDPVSQIINKVIGLQKDDSNCVGFYYKTEQSTCLVTLFNIYDNNLVPWLSRDYNMNLFLTSPYVSNIIFYPLILNHDNSSKLLLSRSSLSHTSKVLTIDIFRSLVSETINSNIPCDKKSSYSSLLLNNYTITGYTIVNKVLSKLMGQYNENNYSNIIPSPFLKKSVSMMLSNTNRPDQNVTEIMRKELGKFAEIFIDLFITRTEFRSEILSKYTNKSSNTICKLDNLFDIERELVTYIVSGFKTGIISTYNLNQIINNLVQERFVLNNYHQVPLIFGSKETVKIVPENIQSTLETTIEKPNSLKSMGDYLASLVDSFNNSETTVVNLETLVSLYNDIVKDDKYLRGIDNGGVTKSKQGIVINSGTSDDIKSDMLPVSMYNSNISLMEKEKLLDMVVYIDSLRDTDGIRNMKYDNLQNEIMHELSMR